MPSDGPLMVSDCIPPQVGLVLPPLSFHHVDADTLHTLDRMQASALSMILLIAIDGH